MLITSAHAFAPQPVAYINIKKTAACTPARWFFSFDAQAWAQHRASPGHGWPEEQRVKEWVNHSKINKFFVPTGAIPLPPQAPAPQPPSPAATKQRRRPMRRGRAAPACRHLPRHGNRQPLSHQPNVRRLWRGLPPVMMTSLSAAAKNTSVVNTQKIADMKQLLTKLQRTQFLIDGQAGLAQALNLDASVPGSRMSAHGMVHRYPPAN